MVWHGIVGVRGLCRVGLIEINVKGDFLNKTNINEVWMK